MIDFEKRKTVDVIIPVLNGAEFIEGCLESVGNQSYPLEKILIIDNGSTDSTKRKIFKFKNKNKKLKIDYCYIQERGPSLARNFGIKESRSEYLAFLDVDDRWRPNKIEEQIRLFNTSKLRNLGLVYNQVEIIREKVKVPTFPKAKLRGYIFERLLLGGNQLTGSSSAVLIKRECFEKCGFFNESLTFGEDWEMWLRISKFYTVDFVNLKLTLINWHSQSIQNNTRRGIIQDLIILNRFYKYEQYSPTDNRINCLKFLRRTNYKMLLNLSNEEEVLESLKKIFDLQRGIIFSLSKIAIIPKIFGKLGWI